MNDDDVEEGSDLEPCDCHTCTLMRQSQAMGAANYRRGVWTDVFMEKIKHKIGPAEAAKIASQAVAELDKAFPEVKTAAMREDR